MTKTSSSQTAKLRKQAEEITRKKAAKSPENFENMSPAQIKKTLHELRVHQVELELQNEELRQTQVKLDDAGVRFFDFYDMAPVGYVTVNEKGLILEVNLTTATMLGLTRSDLIKQPLSRFILPADQDIHYLKHKNILETYEPQAYELRMLKKDGSTFWARLQVITAQDSKGETVCRIVLSDVTERKQKDEALLENEARFQIFFMKSPIGINAFDSEGKVIAVNSVARRYFGVSDDDPLIGYSLFEDPSISDETKAKIRDGQIATEERFIDFQAIKKHQMYDTIKNEEDRVYIQLTYTPYGPIKNPTGYIAIIQDITERKRLEEVQAFLAQTSSGAKDESFFEVLARYLAQNLSMDYVCIDRLEGDELTARTVAVWCDGHFDDNVIYALKDTPCGDLVGKAVCCFPASVCQLFPRDPALQELRAESYVGVTLWSHTGQPIGLIAVIGRHPLSLAKRPLIEEMLKMVGVRAAGEMERLDALEMLRDSEERYRTLANRIPDIIYSLDSEGNIVTINSSAFDRYGYSEQEAIGKSFLDFVHPEDSEILIKSFLKAIEDKRKLTTNLQFRMVAKNGSSYWFELNANAKFDSNDRYIGEDGVLRDITERKLMEAYREMGREVLQILNGSGDLQESAQRVLETLKTRTGFDAVGIRLQDGDDFPYFSQQGFSDDFLLTENTLIERDASGGICRDKDGNVSLECTCGLIISGKSDPANPLFTQAGSAWTNDSLPFLDVPPGDDPRHHPRNQCIHKGYASIAIVPIRSKDMIVGLIQFNDRRKGCFTLESVELMEGIASHIGEALMRKQAEADKEKLEAQNRQLQKSESLSRMAASIAHHFNNQLGVVIGNLEMAIDEQPKGATTSRSLASAMDAAWKSADMSRLMLTYLGQLHDEVEPLDISSSCSKIMPILNAAMPTNVILTSDFSSPGPLINTNLDYIQQILTNLITNALEAVGKNSGTISLSAKTVSPAKIPSTHRFPADWKLPDNPCACLEVTDTGCGIEDKDIEQLFDPFYSTKFTGRGMGLAVVLGIVKTHRGVITVSSHP